MSKYCPENEKLKRDYAFHLETAEGKQVATISAALKAIERFEISTGWKPFRKFHHEQARSFRARLAEEKGARGEPLSAATITSTLKHLRSFFIWLSREPGFRSAINANHAKFFSPSEQDCRIAGARRDRTPPTVADFHQVLAKMPATSVVEKRDQALIAFALVSGARIGAIITFRLKHIDVEARTVNHDAREVKTKNGKSWVSTFFPVGPEPERILANYIALLKELGFGPDDPLFPCTAMAHDQERNFAAQGLSRIGWSTSEPARRIFKAAFQKAGLPAIHPHLTRKTLALHGDSLDLTREEEKAYSMNFGHESIWTTRESYGTLPQHRQAAIMHRLAEPKSESAPDSNIADLEAVLTRMKASQRRTGAAS
jgi:integrase